MGVVRPGRCLGVVLHRKERQGAVPQSFVGVVIQIYVRDFDVARWQRIRIHAESMILRGDLHLAAQEIFHRMIRSMVAETQLERFAAKREAAELVAQANSKNGHAAKQATNGFNQEGMQIRSGNCI